MSTKIWDAYRSEFKSIDELHKEILSLRKTIHPALKKQLYMKIAEKWASYIDECTISEDPTIDTTKLIFEIAQDVFAKHKKIRHTGERNPGYDFWFEVVIIPHKGKQYIKVFCEHEYRSLLYLFDKHFQEFHYQNQSDRPEEIPEKEWEERERIWDEIFGDNNIWSELGFIYDFSITWHDVPFRYDQIKQYIPSLEKRAKVVAYKSIISERLSERNTKEEEITSTYIEIIKELKTSKGQKQLQLKAEEIQPRLLDIDKIGNNHEEQLTQELI